MLSIKVWLTKLPEAVGGSCINGVKYNVFCYADDILLCSINVTGLQKLINLANRYISYQGLSFKPAKRKCMVFGKCYLDRQPSWVLNRSVLDVQCNGGLKYLGATLSAKCGKQHVQDRVAACRRAFYGMRMLVFMPVDLLHCGSHLENCITNCVNVRGAGGTLK